MARCCNWRVRCRDAGVGPGDRVLWMGQNCHRVLEALAACAHIGAVFCPVNWRQSSDELAFVLDDADPKLVFWQEEEVGEAVRAARDAASTSARWIQHDGDSSDDGEESYAAFVAASPPSRRTGWIRWTRRLFPRRPSS